MLVMIGINPNAACLLHVSKLKVSKPAAKQEDAIRLAPKPNFKRPRASIEPAHPPHQFNI